MAVPLLLRLAGQPVLCVGAGPVAAAKVGPLLADGAAVTVVAPEVHPDLDGVARVLRRPFADGDVAGAEPRPRLVVAGTGVPAVDDRVAAEAAAVGVWCLRVAGESEVVVPAVVRRGGVLVALATGAPALTRRLRQAVDEVVDDRWGAAAEVLAALRSDPGVRASLSAREPSDRRRRWRAAVDLALAADVPGVPGAPGSPAERAAAVRRALVDDG